jgi:hypothetical protein
MTDVTSVWYYFKHKKGEKKVAECLSAGCTYSLVMSKTMPTNQLWNHLEKKHPHSYKIAKLAKADKKKQQEQMQKDREKQQSFFTKKTVSGSQQQPVVLSQTELSSQMTSSSSQTTTQPTIEECTSWWPLSVGVSHR